MNSNSHAGPVERGTACVESGPFVVWSTLTHDTEIGPVSGGQSLKYIDGSLSFWSGVDPAINFLYAAEVVGQYDIAALIERDASDSSSDERLSSLTLDLQAMPLGVGTCRPRGAWTDFVDADSGERSRGGSHSQTGSGATEGERTTKKTASTLSIVTLIGVSGLWSYTPAHAADSISQRSPSQTLRRHGDREAC